MWRTTSLEDKEVYASQQVTRPGEGTSVYTTRGNRRTIEGLEADTNFLPDKGTAKVILEGFSTSEHMLEPNDDNRNAISKESP